MSTDEPCFELAPWRKRPLADDGAVVGIGGPSVVFALGAALVLPSLWRVAGGVVWIMTAAVLAGVLALAWVFGHPRYDRGGIRFTGGHLHVDQGRGSPFVVPIAAIRAAMVMRHAEGDRLVLHVEGAHLALSIRLVRLVDPLDELLYELRSQIARHGDLAAFDRGSDRQVASIGWAFAVCGLIAVVVALWRMVA